MRQVILVVLNFLLLQEIVSAASALSPDASQLTGVNAEEYKKCLAWLQTQGTSAASLGAALLSQGSSFAGSFSATGSITTIVIAVVLLGGFCFVTGKLLKLAFKIAISWSLLIFTVLSIPPLRLWVGEYLIAGAGAAAVVASS